MAHIRRYRLLSERELTDLTDALVSELRPALAEWLPAADAVSIKLAEGGDELSSSEIAVCCDCVYGSDAWFQWVCDEHSLTAIVGAIYQLKSPEFLSPSDRRDLTKRFLEDLSVSVRKPVAASSFSFETRMDGEKEAAALPKGAMRAAFLISGDGWRLRLRLLPEFMEAWIGKPKATAALSAVALGERLSGLLADRQESYIVYLRNDAQLPLQELRSLEPGDVIAFDVPTEAHVDLVGRESGIKLAGRLGKKGSRRAVQLQNP